MSDAGAIDRKALLTLPLLDLAQRANRTRKEFISTAIDLCSIINAKSGLCSEDCKFCAQSSRHATAITTHPLKIQLYAAFPFLNNNPYSR